MAKSQTITNLLKLCEEKWIEAGYMRSTVANFRPMEKEREETRHCGDFLNAALENPDAPFIKRNIQLRSYDLCGEIGEVAQKLIELKKKERVRPDTLTVYRRVLSEFNQSLN